MSESSARQRKTKPGSEAEPSASPPPRPPKKAKYFGASTLRWFSKQYNSINSIVNVPFLTFFSLFLYGAVWLTGPDGQEFLENLNPPASKNGTQLVGEWKFLFGEGKDVMGKVNCTSFRHKSLGTIVEFGHGSGGGVSFRPKSDDEARWVWHDGSLEPQEDLACDDVESKLKRGKGRSGTPKYQMFNRYNQVFWVPTLEDGGNITIRNVVNPVRVTLHSSGFTMFVEDLVRIQVVDGDTKWNATNETNSSGPITVPVIEKAEDVEELKKKGI